MRDERWEKRNRDLLSLLLDDGRFFEDQDESWELANEIDEWDLPPYIRAERRNIKWD